MTACVGHFRFLRVQEWSNHRKKRQDAQAPQDGRLYDSVSSFAERTSFSDRAIWKLVAAGSIPSLRVGGRRLIPITEAVEALERLGSRGGAARDQRRAVRATNT